MEFNQYEYESIWYLGWSWFVQEWGLPQNAAFIPENDGQEWDSALTTMFSDISILPSSSPWRNVRLVYYIYLSYSSTKTLQKPPCQHKENCSWAVPRHKTALSQLADLWVQWFGLTTPRPQGYETQFKITHGACAYSTFCVYPIFVYFCHVYLIFDYIVHMLLLWPRAEQRKWILAKN